MRHVCVALALAGVITPLTAQTDTPAANAAASAAATITAAGVARHVGVLAHDSMLGRDTPSRGLELTAQYVADQFQAIGLTPRGDGGSWLQRYPIPLQIDFARSRVVFAAGGATAAASFTTATRFALPLLPQQLGQGSVLLVTGRHTAASLRRIPMRNKIVLYLPPAGGDSVLRQKLIARLVTTAFDSSLASGPEGVIILSEEDSATFHRHLQAGLQLSIHRPKPRPASLYQAQPPSWAVQVRPAAVTGLQLVLAASGLDLMQARTDSTPVVRELPALTITLDVRLTDTVSDTATAPNVVGLLEGSDPELRREYVVFSAHMDHLGLSPGQADSIHNGADDNASGVAGLLALANAFRQPGARPRRSVLFSP